MDGFSALCGHGSHFLKLHYSAFKSQMGWQKEVSCDLDPRLHA